MLYGLIFMFILLVVVFLKIISLLLSEMVFFSREESSVYECGFEQHSMSRVPFSLRYFYLTLLFLLFDLEIIFMIFIIYSIYSVFYYYSMIIFIFFVLILFFGLVYEWKDGTLDWVD